MAKGTGYRSAISGRFVTTRHGKASPHTTLRESSPPALRGRVHASQDHLRGLFMLLCRDRRGLLLPGLRT